MHQHFSCQGFNAFLGAHGARFRARSCPPPPGPPARPPAASASSARVRAAVSNRPAGPAWATPSSLDGRGLRCRAASMPSRTRTWRARYTVMAATATASAVRSSVQTGPSDPWSQSSQILGPASGQRLGRAGGNQLLQVCSFLGVQFHQEALVGYGGSRRQGRTKIVVGTFTGGPPIHVASYTLTKLDH